MMCVWHGDVHHASMGTPDNVQTLDTHISLCMKLGSRMHQPLSTPRLLSKGVQPL